MRIGVKDHFKCGGGVGVTSVQTDRGAVFLSWWAEILRATGCEQAARPATKPVLIMVISGVWWLVLVRCEVGQVVLVVGSFDNIASSIKCDGEPEAATSVDVGDAAAGRSVWLRMVERGSLDSSDLVDIFELGGIDVDAANVVAGFGRGFS